MSIQVNCDVCYETKPLASIRVLTTCGHAFCQACIEDIAARRRWGDPPCPNCRVPFKPAQTIQVFLQGPPSAPPPPSKSITSSVKEEDDTDVTRLAQHVSQAFGKLDARSTIDELEAVIDDLVTLSGCMISSRSDRADRDGAIQACLIGISQFMELIIPVFAVNTKLTHAEVARLGFVSEVASAGASDSTPLAILSSSQQRAPRRTIPALRGLAASITVPHARCFVKNVTTSVAESLLRSMLTQRFGSVKDIHIYRPKACAFVEFATIDAARRAIIASMPVALGGEGGVRLGVSHSAPRVLIVAQNDRLFGLGQHSRIAIH